MIEGLCFYAIEHGATDSRRADDEPHPGVRANARQDKDAVVPGEADPVPIEAGIVAPARFAALKAPRNHDANLEVPHRLSVAIYDRSADGTPGLQLDVIRGAIELERHVTLLAVPLPEDVKADAG